MLFHKLQNIPIVEKNKSEFLVWTIPPDAADDLPSGVLYCVNNEPICCLVYPHPGMSASLHQIKCSVYWAAWKPAGLQFMVNKRENHILYYLL